MSLDDAAPKMKYDAFISYSHHADSRLAPALQRGLHDFARPGFLKRALHVFRDETTLAASPELWTAIESSLGVSRFLLLMASPAAAASHWVGREVAWWMANRSPHTMLILVTEGEVIWDETRVDFDWQRTNCLPPEGLRGRLKQEPLWVDLRWTRSAEVLKLRNTRFRQAVLDIAAPLHGRDKDELDGEDVRLFLRAQKRRRAAIVGLVVLTVLAVGFGIAAKLQRDEALRQTLLVQLGRMAVQADLLRARGEPADASVVLAAGALSGLHGLGEPRRDADLALRNALSSLPHTLHEFDFPDSRYRMSPDGRLLVTTNPTVETQAAYQLPDGHLRSCDAGRIHAAQVPAGQTWVVALSPDARWCIIGRGHGAYELWASEPLRQVASWQDPATGARPTFAVAPGGDILARTLRGSAEGTAASSVRVWNRSTGSELLSRRGDEFVAFSPDGRYLATTSGLWLLRDGPSDRPRQVWAWSRPPLDGVAFSPSGDVVAVRLETAGIVEVWSTAKKEVVYRLDRVPPGQLAAVGDGGWALAVIGAADTWLWDGSTDRVRVRLPGAALAAAFEGRDLLALVDIDMGHGLRRQRLVRLPWLGAAFAALPLPAGLDAQTVESIDVEAETVRLAIRGEQGPTGLAWRAGGDRWTKDEAPRIPGRAASKAPAENPIATRRREGDPGQAAAAGPLAVRIEPNRVFIDEEGAELAQLDVSPGVRLAGISRDGRTAAVLDMGDVVSLHHTAPADLVGQACARDPLPLPPPLLRLLPDDTRQDACTRPLAPRPKPACANILCFFGRLVQAVRER